VPFDKKKAAEWITTNAYPPFGKGVCATNVRQALEAGGLNTAGHPEDAKDWGPTLVGLGFRVVAGAPMMGDVMVIQATSSSVSGHMELYDGKNWVSDFVQREMWPGPGYRAETPKHEMYRY